MVKHDKRNTCAICGEFIDKSACGEEWGTFTKTTDDGDRHRSSVVLCGLHSIAVDIFIQQEALTNENREHKSFLEICKEHGISEEEAEKSWKERKTQ